MENIPDMWQRIDQLFFSLMPDGYRKGQQTFRNRISIGVEFDRSVTAAERQRIMDAIETALTLRVDPADNEQPISS